MTMDPIATLRSILNGPTFQNQQSGSDLCDALEALSGKDSGTAKNIAELIAAVLPCNSTPSGKQGMVNTVAKAELDETQVLTRVPGVSAVLPRGKFDLLFCKDSFHLVNKVHNMCVPYQAVETIFILDKIPEERKGKVYLLLNLRSGCTVQHGQKQLKNIALETKEGVEWSIPSPKRDTTGAPLPNIKMKVSNFNAPDGVFFKSMAGLPCIGALHRFNKGWLFPLPRSLVYIGTPCFVIHHMDILGVDLPGAGTERRNFDMRVFSKTGDLMVELCQLESSDLAAWADYMAKTRLKQVAGEAGTDDEAGAGDSCGDDDESEEDSDFDPEGGNEAEDDDKRPQKRARSSLGAGAAGSSGVAQLESDEEDEGGSGDLDGGASSDEDSEDYGVEMIDEDETVMTELQSGAEPALGGRGTRSARR